MFLDVPKEEAVADNEARADDCCEDIEHNEGPPRPGSPVVFPPSFKVEEVCRNRVLRRGNTLRKVAVPLYTSLRRHEN